MYALKRLIKKLFTSITIMVIPHSSREPIRMKVPSVGILAAAVLCMLGMGYVLKMSREAFLYRPTKEKLDYYVGQLGDLQSTISSIKLAEKEFRRLFSLKSKKDVLENLDTSDSGALDMEAVARQINETVNNIGEIKDYLRQERDLYMATPTGFPVARGYVSSNYGGRTHPIKGTADFHTGLDISSNPGEPIHATADGIVSFAGWSGASGNMVAVEHGAGFQSFYAHTKKNLVQVGQTVKRGDVIAYVGSTGSSTGPHVHYEIWKAGRHVNPAQYAMGAGNVLEKR